MKLLPQFSTIKYFLSVLLLLKIAFKQSYADETNSIVSMVLSLLLEDMK